MGKYRGIGFTLGEEMDSTEDMKSERKGVKKGYLG